MKQVLPGLVLGFFEVTVLASISVAISTRLPMLVNLVVCIAIFFLGHLSPVLVEATSQGKVNELVSFMAKLFAWVLPVAGVLQRRPGDLDRGGDPLGRLRNSGPRLLRVVQWSGPVVRVPPVRGSRPGLSRAWRIPAPGRLESARTPDRRAGQGTSLLPSPMGFDACKRTRTVALVSSWTQQPECAVTRRPILGVVHSLLILSLLVVGGPARGAARHAGRGPATDSDAAASFPSWVPQPDTGTDQARAWSIDDTGLFPLVAGNLSSPNPAPPHRCPRCCCGCSAGVPTLRNNSGALTTLLASGLGLLLMLCLIAQFRRSVLAEAVCDVATALRRQIHRQMYRLGQSSLPTEGTGPVVNLFTREVNDVRDGLFADLDHGYRMPVLAAGLLVFALVPLAGPDDLPRRRSAGWSG